MHGLGAWTAIGLGADLVSALGVHEVLN